MQSPPTLIWRHRRENLNKCSLRGLESRSDFKFFCYPVEELPDLSNYIALSIDAPSLDEISSLKTKGILLLDGTWRYAEKMARKLVNTPTLTWYSLPANFHTAYPRRQEDCLYPDRGLASVEALYITCHLLGRSTEGILDNYHWKELFLEKNAKLFAL